jgi:putative nucleotidyltransferase with HDIG domain
MVRMVRAFGDEPRYYNDPTELGELEPYLAEAGTSRMMLVPLASRFIGLVGFVDVRDKGAQRPFAERDRELALSIAEALTGLVENIRTDATEPSPAEVESKPVVFVESTTDPGRGGAPEMLLDEDGIDDLNAVAADCLDDPRVVAVALSLVDRRSGSTLIHQRSSAPAVEIDSLITHQLDALGRVSAAVPRREAWKTELRRVVGPSVVARRPVIASAVLMHGAGSAVSASVVADTEPAVAGRALARLGRRATASQENFRLRIARRGLARRLLQPGDRRYPELVAHSLGVSRLCWSIARVLGLDPATVENAALAGLLHDVGMRELDYDRLYMHPTPGPDDRRTYRMHVEVGDRIVRVQGFTEIADAVRHHHERWDGNGYPDRLETTAIPLLARIVHVAEVFDLFTAANSYRPAVSHERAQAILERAAGHQFDPRVVEAMAKVET